MQTAVTQNHLHGFTQLERHTHDCSKDVNNLWLQFVEGSLDNFLRKYKSNQAEILCTA